MTIYHEAQLPPLSQGSPPTIQTQFGFEFRGWATWSTDYGQPEGDFFIVSWLAGPGPVRVEINSTGPVFCWFGDAGFGASYGRSIDVGAWPEQLTLLSPDRLGVFVSHRGFTQEPPSFEPISYAIRFVSIPEPEPVMLAVLGILGASIWALLWRKI